MILDRRARGAWLAALLGVLAVLGGVVVTNRPDCAEHCQVVAAGIQQPAPSPTEPPALRVRPAGGADDVDPLTPVIVTADTGTLSSVTMVNDSGKAVAGIMTPDNKAWKPTAQLGYGRTYTMTIAGRGPGGMPTRQTSSFTTVTPSNQTQVYFNTTGGNLLQDGGTYGVGMVIVAHFDEPITDKANAERNLKVSTTPIVQGSWYWTDDQNAHWRPEKYWAPGTSVTVNANVYGVPMGKGLYGQEDEKVSFTIGDAHVSIADDNTKQVSVFENGKLVRTMPTSMGKGGTETIGGTTFSFWTPPGVYTVMDKANPVIMDSSTYGLPINSRLGYRDDHPVRDPHQHRRHLPAPAQRHHLGAGQHQHQSRLPEPQRRQRAVVLQLLAARRRRRGPQHRRSGDSSCGRTATGVCRGWNGARAARCPDIGDHERALTARTQSSAWRR